MRIAVCDAVAAEREQMRHWIAQYCQLYDLLPEIDDFSREENFFDAFQLRRFEVVFMGFGGPEGFLAARKLRDADRECAILYVDDTEAYAVRSARLHFTDYIVRPVTFPHIVRAMKLAGVP